MIIYNGNAAILQKVSEIASNLNPTALVTATNAKAARKTWLEQAKHGRFTNPLFLYDEDLQVYTSGCEAQFEHYAHHIREHTISTESFNPYSGDQFVLSALERFFTEYDLSIKLAKGSYTCHTADAGRASRILFGIPAYTTVENAKDAARLFKKPSTAEDTPTLDASAIAAAFEATIAKLGITGWQVEVSETATAIDVRDQTQTIVIPSGRKVSPAKLLKLKGHELNCHLLGSANTTAVFHQLLGRGHAFLKLARFLAKSLREDMYEGVAKSSDVELKALATYKGGPNSEVPLPWYVIAIDWAMKGHDFASTAANLTEYLTLAGYTEAEALSKAWTYTYRVFRGSPDTSDPEYIYTKDFAYFEGYNAYQTAIPELRQIYSRFSSLDLQTLENFAPFLMQQTPAFHPLGVSDL